LYFFLLDIWHKEYQWKDSMDIFPARFISLW